MGVFVCMHMCNVYGCVCVWYVCLCMYMGVCACVWCVRLCLCVVCVYSVYGWVCVWAVWYVCLSIMCIVCACLVRVHVCYGQVWKGEDSFHESVLSFYHVRHEDVLSLRVGDGKPFLLAISPAQELRF